MKTKKILAALSAAALMLTAVPAEPFSELIGSDLFSASALRGGKYEDLVINPNDDPVHITEDTDADEIISYSDNAVIIIDEGVTLYANKIRGNSLTLEGKGTLDVESEDVGSLRKNLTVNGVTLNIKNGNDDNLSFDACKQFTMNSGNVNIFATRPNAFKSDYITINGGSFYCENDSDINPTIYITYGVKLNGGSVCLKNKNANGSSYDVLAGYKKVTLAGGDFTANRHFSLGGVNADCLEIAPGLRYHGYDSTAELHDFDSTSELPVDVLNDISVLFPDTKSLSVDDSVANGVIETGADFEGAYPVGKLVTLNITPDSGYLLKSLSYTVEDGDPVILDPADPSFVMPENNVTINAEFAQGIAYADENGEKQLVWQNDENVIFLVNR